MSDHSKNKPSLLKQAGLQILAGGSAGFVEVCLMHPLDLVKTRLQIQNRKSIGNTAISSPANEVRGAHVKFNTNLKTIYTL